MKPAVKVERNLPAIVEPIAEASHARGAFCHDGSPSGLWCDTEEFSVLRRKVQVARH